jgi:hypothetical protein
VASSTREAGDLGGNGLVTHSMLVSSVLSYLTLAPELMIAILVVFVSPAAASAGVLAVRDRLLGLVAVSPRRVSDPA